ncbi:Bug family tripartite tricarboxylate transporter substrate binding protein [Falsiroseomonas sp. E2-1-a20]|uniref:Bug family tripartite tricarboxylate transporter substrate binding protein n=1 Tax=Falsiroseomonas sp. E2-1-a20 TaxID=3239300 RepID=UPI003F35F23E
MLTRRNLAVLAAAGFGAAGTGPASGQASTYPAGPVRVVIPFAPGAATDILSRLMAQQFAEAFGSPFVAENRTGANGAIAADLVARGPKDGSLILMGTFSTHATNPHIYPRFPYDPIADFAPVTLVATVPQLLAVHPALGVSSVAELREAALARPGRIVAATGGLGSSQHLSAVLFNRSAGVELEIIHYTRGFATVVPDLLENRVNLTFGDPLALLPMVREGRLRALATTGEDRSPLWPDVPTMAELGLPGATSLTWYGLFVAAGTDPAIVERLGAVAGQAIRKPDVARRIREFGAIPSGNTPAEFAAFQRAEFTRWGEVIRAAGIRVE